ncbi:hypothetical protein BDU57DRAFT_526622 [Ampelomyces quisqualis]|uniref:Uncharacterized protein n=1 Tax=Ampelomyces quisqualis TaxID=50730 RepID=A0A6A5R3W8_AMPQU|nr:hypothetical protein BDU57DRAFT_526622 [Ampelomyces quisqualis]
MRYRSPYFVPAHVPSTCAPADLWDLASLRSRTEELDPEENSNPQRLKTLNSTPLRSLSRTSQLVPPRGQTHFSVIPPDYPSSAISVGAQCGKSSLHFAAPNRVFARECESMLYSANASRLTTSRELSTQPISSTYTHGLFKLPAQSITHAKCMFDITCYCAARHLPPLCEPVSLSDRCNLPDNPRSNDHPFTSDPLYHGLPSYYGHRPSDNIEIPEYLEIGEHDESLEDGIARMVDNVQLRDDGWLVPILQEDMTGVYQALGQMNAEATQVEKEDEGEGEAGARGLEVKDGVWCVVVVVVAYGVYKLLR